VRDVLANIGKVAAHLVRVDCEQFARALIDFAPPLRKALAHRSRDFRDLEIPASRVYDRIAVPAKLFGELMVVNVLYVFLCR
jgi:hypothetical protein